MIFMCSRVWNAVIESSLSFGNERGSDLRWDSPRAREAPHNLRLLLRQ